MNNLPRPSGRDFQPGKIERTFGNVVNADELHQQALQERYPGRSKILPVVREAAGTETAAPGKWRGLRLPASKWQVESRHPCAISPRRHESRPRSQFARHHFKHKKSDHFRAFPKMAAFYFQHILSDKKPEIFRFPAHFGGERGI